MMDEKRKLLCFCATVIIVTADLLLGSFDFISQSLAN